MCCSDTDYDQANTWCALHDLDLDSVTSADDVAVVRYLCSALSIRAAQIVAASAYFVTYFLTASVSVQHVRDILELTHSKNFLKMSNLETLFFY